jgi:hypothetical protein
LSGVIDRAQLSPPIDLEQHQNAICYLSDDTRLEVAAPESEIKFVFRTSLLVERARSNRLEMYISLESGTLRLHIKGPNWVSRVRMENRLVA